MRECKSRTHRLRRKRTQKTETNSTTGVFLDKRSKYYFYLSCHKRTQKIKIIFAKIQLNKNKF